MTSFQQGMIRGVVLAILVFVLLFFWIDISKSHPNDPDEIMLLIKINRVYDGDTVYVDIPNIPDIFGKDIGIRILNTQAPEKRGAPDCEKYDAAVATVQLIKFLRTEPQWYINNMQRGKFFRVVADIVNADKTKSVSKFMLDNKLALFWDGFGKKPTWYCKDKTFSH